MQSHASDDLQDLAQVIAMPRGQHAQRTEDCFAQNAVTSSATTASPRSQGQHVAELQADAGAGKKQTRVQAQSLLDLAESA